MMPNSRVAWPKFKLSGSVSSPWVDIRTLEASPAHLTNFTVEQREQSRALLLSWEQPRTPNGIITVHIRPIYSKDCCETGFFMNRHPSFFHRFHPFVLSTCVLFLSLITYQMYHLYNEGNLEFSGLSRNFLFRRLEPWTMYSLTLEACTSAGCTRTSPQDITTAAAPPASQHPPKPFFIGPDSVSLSWGPPTQPNGPIGEYFLLGRTRSKDIGRGRSNEEDVEDGKVSDVKVM